MIIFAALVRVARLSGDDDLLEYFPSYLCRHFARLYLYFPQIRDNILPMEVVPFLFGVFRFFVTAPTSSCSGFWRRGSRGISAAAHGRPASVVITDLNAETIANLAHNIELNRDRYPMGSEVGCAAVMGFFVYFILYSTNFNSVLVQFYRCSSNKMWKPRHTPHA